ncbi:MAG: tRNA pseudouridine(55) synthase TruB [Alphaproteobacteria bacterium]
MARGRKKGDPISGWVNLDKPYGMTSTQAIGKVRRFLNAQKIGHAGTLDPLATGILPIALGDATKTIPFAQDAIKTYLFTVTWGEQRATDDAEGEVIATSDHKPSQKDIINALPTFTGNIEQTPPIFSAIKIHGARAYDLARAGEIPELKSRIVSIQQLDLISHDEQSATLRTTCGKGTYIRSLARDLAIHLGTVGYVSMLRREKVGVFTEQNAISLDIIEEMDYVAARSEALLPLQTVLDDIPALALKEEETVRLRNGQALQFVSRPDFSRLTKVGLGQKEAVIALATYDDQPVALVEQARAEIKPVRVFNIF